MDTEIIVAAARGTNTNATAVSANVLVDERQMNALFLDVVSSKLCCIITYIPALGRDARNEQILYLYSRFESVNHMA